MSTILVIDDDPATVQLPDGIEAVSIEPSDANVADSLTEGLNDAGVILVDQELNLGDVLSLQALDGASLVAHFRSWARRKDLVLPPVLLVTSQPEAYKHEVPAVGAPVPLDGTFVGREHRIAPTLDVEWLLSKDDLGFAEKVASFVAAFDASTAAFGHGGTSLAELAGLVALPEAIWSERARKHLIRARPPVTEAQGIGATPARGSTAALRWLLHRALPFPGLFLSDLYASWTLGITLDSFQAWIEGEPRGDLHPVVLAAKYRGPFAGLTGRRWWTAGVDQAAWAVDEKTDETRDRAEALSALSGGILQPLAVDDPIVVWTDDLTESAIASMSASVVVHPPGWPAEAIEPWMLVQDLNGDAVLTAMVDPDDRQVLEPET